MFTSRRIITVWLLAFALGAHVKPSNPAACQDLKQSPLLQAVDKDNLAVVRSLLARGADVNQKDPEGFTPLYYAVCQDSLEMCRLLLTKGADVNASLKGGNSVLTEATGRGYTEVTLLLLKSGANVNAKDDHGQTALQVSADAANPAIVRALITRGAEVNAINTAGNSALLLAVRAEAFINNALDGKLGQRETFGAFWGGQIAWRMQEYMRKHHTGYVNDVVQKKIIVGLQKDYVTTVKILLAAEADPNIRDRDNKSVFDYAQGKANASLLKVLRQDRK